MPTFFPRRFTNLEFLRTIAPENLISFLSPFREYLAGQGLTFPASGDGKLDYETLVSILVSADGQMPKGLVDSLYYVHEMSTLDAMNTLLEKAPPGLLDFDGTGDPTPGDVAIVAWLKNRAFVEERHSERFLERTKTFICYQGAIRRSREAPASTDDIRRGLELDLDDWFEGKRRGRGCRIFVHPRGDEVWFLVRHGDPIRREGTYDNGKADSVYYRPEKYDVLIYYCGLDRLAVHAATQGEKGLYKRVFGRHLFGDVEYFGDGVSFTLEPLRQNGEAALNCECVPGIEWIKLKEMEIYQANSMTVIYKASDFFGVLGDRAADVLDSGHLWRAGFNVKFSDSRTPRVLNLRPPAGAGYMRDSDRVSIEAWMRHQGFLVVEPTDGEASTTVAGA
jgi:hypothetical protein